MTETLKFNEPEPVKYDEPPEPPQVDTEQNPSSKDNRRFEEAWESVESTNETAAAEADAMMPDYPPEEKHTKATIEASDNGHIDLNLGMDFGEVIKASIDALVTKHSDKINTQLDALVTKAIDDLRPTVVIIGDRETVEIKERTHKKFKEVLFLATQHRQVFLSGEAGTGKTTLAGQIAKAMKLDFAHISCSLGMSEAHLTGRMLFDGTYVEADFVRLYENGGVFLFDEIDAADPNTILIINSALANGTMSVPNRKDNSTAVRHADFICICAGNTWGHGDANYIGRNPMDAAFMDRFTGSKVLIDYDKALEKAISKEVHSMVADTLHKIRKAVKDNQLQRVISTRAFYNATVQIKAGATLEEFLQRLTVDWSDEEIAKLGDLI